MLASDSERGEFKTDSATYTLIVKYPQNLAYDGENSSNKFSLELSSPEDAHCSGTARKPDTYSFVITTTEGIQFIDEKSQAIRPAFSLSTCPGQNIYAATVSNDRSVNLGSWWSTGIYHIRVVGYPTQPGLKSLVTSVHGRVLNVLQKFLEVAAMPDGWLIALATIFIHWQLDKQRQTESLEKQGIKNAVITLRNAMSGSEEIARRLEEWNGYLANHLSFSQQDTEAEARARMSEDDSINQKIVSGIHEGLSNPKSQAFSSTNVLQEIKHFAELLETTKTSKTDLPKRVRELLIIARELAGEEIGLDTNMVTFDDPELAGAYSFAKSSYSGQIEPKLLEGITTVDQAEKFLYGSYWRYKRRGASATPQDIFWESLAKLASPLAADNATNAQVRLREAVVKCAYTPNHNLPLTTELSEACKRIVKHWAEIHRQQAMQNNVWGRFIEVKQWHELLMTPSDFDSMSSSKHHVVFGASDPLDDKSLKGDPSNIPQMQERARKSRRFWRHSLEGGVRSKGYSMPTLPVHYLLGQSTLHSADLVNQLRLLAICVSNELFAFLCETGQFVEYPIQDQNTIAGFLKTYKWDIPPIASGVVAPPFNDEDFNIEQRYRDSAGAGTYELVKNAIAGISTQTSNKEPTKDGILRDIQQALVATGFKQIFVLIDHLDEAMRERHKRNSCIQLIKSLFSANKDLNLHSIYLKVFLPADLIEEPDFQRFLSCNVPMSSDNAGIPLVCEVNP